MAKNPQPPKGLTTKESRTLWRTVLATYDVDGAALEVLRVAVFSLDNFLKYQEMLARSGPVFKSKSGQFKKNPVAELVKVERVGFLQSMRDLGLEGDQELQRRPGRPTKY